MICGDCGRELTFKSLEGTHKGYWYICEKCREYSVECDCGDPRHSLETYPKLPPRADGSKP